jgi:hypothetical protein
MAPGQDNGHTRRYLLQTGAAALATGLAGCAGGNGSDSSDEPDEENNSDVDTTPEETADPEPDYSLPESEHASPVDMATEWMIFPDEQGDYLQAVAYNPSKVSEIHDTTLADDIGADERYEAFEFNHTDIPESYIQHANDPWLSRFKVDQLPNNVSEEDIVQQLEDSGYTMQHERGDFEVYAGEDGFHAVGDDRHVVVLGGDTASTSQERDLMFRVLEETNDNRYELPEVTQRGLEELDVQDSLSIMKRPGYALMPSTGTRSYQPEIGMSSVDFDEGQKNGAWSFSEGKAAENALTLLENNDVRHGYSDLELNNKVVTAQEGDYDISELGTSSWLRVSESRI